MTNPNGHPTDDLGGRRLADREERLRERLDGWRLSAVPDDLDALGAELARSARRPRRSARAPLAGVAAAFVALGALVSLGARVERDGDRVALSVSLPWIDRDATTADRLEDVERRAEAIARHTTTLALTGFLESHAEGDRLRRDHDEARLVRLATAVDRALATERARTERLLDAVLQGASAADLRTREALVELAAYVHEEGR